VYYEFEKKSPKLYPKPFFVQNNTQHFSGEKDLNYFCNLKNRSEKKNYPIGERAGLPDGLVSNQKS
jgi:hypothetical protein